MRTRAEIRAQAICSAAGARIGQSGVRWALALALTLAGSAVAEGVPRTKAPDGARCYIISPTEGETVTSPFTVRFGTSGIGVAPAGVDHANTGHHHLIIDAPLPPADLPIPKDDVHVHFGGGQTEAQVELPPGQHTLQLLLGDLNHVPHDPPIASQRITIQVK